MGNLLRAAAAACLLTAFLCPGLARAQGGPPAATGTEYSLFWRGDLRIIATRPSTQITLIDAATGLNLTSLYTANINGNPFVLRNAGDSFEADNGGVNTYRIRIVATRSGGPREDKPIIVWTGALAPELKHPALPTSSSNAWMSNLPAIAPGSVENGSELGRDFWGFVTKDMFIFARPGPTPTSISIDDLVTNVDPSSDDTQVLTTASAALKYRDAGIEIYELDQFEDDTVHVTSNTDISVMVGVAARVGNDWTVTPPSFGAGEDGRELGTLFYTFVSRDLTIFPTQDFTNVTITDLSDGDDSTSFLLQNGDLNGDYDVFVTDTYARNGTGMTPRASGPTVRLVQPLTSPPFENDFVKIESDRPILVYVGPKAADTGEYADFAYTLQTGPSSYLLYCYAQNGGAEDLQIFAYDPATSVQITSLTSTTGFRNNGGHDFSIPSPTPWLGGNATTNDWYWASGTWNGELLRIQANGPVNVIDGDYDGPNFGCFIPFVSSSGVLLPIADAGADASLCPGQTTVRLDGTRSFDADTTAGLVVPTWTWDVDPTVDSNGDGDFTNDPDLTGPTPTLTVTGPGPWTITLTYTDDDGQKDTDVMVITAGDTVPPIPNCPPVATGVSDATGTAFVDVLATVSDNCDRNPLLLNDRTPNGGDASGVYPCGETLVVYSAIDASGNAVDCYTTVIVQDRTPPDLACSALLEADSDASGSARIPVLASAADACDAFPVVTNDRTAGGADATDAYPCGETLVTFTATDASLNASSCTTRVVVHDVTPPQLRCVPRWDVAPDSLAGALVPVVASADDACDAAPISSNDRTAGGLDATDFYPCGQTLVTFTSTDASGNRATCTTVVDVAPPGQPVGISPALRVSKIPGSDATTTIELHWEGAPPPQVWEHYEVRRTATDAVRPYPLLLADPTFQASRYVDAAAAGRLWYYQVHVTDCVGSTAPDPLALSP